MKPSSDRPVVAVLVQLRLPGATPTVERIVERFTTSALSLLCGAGADPWVVDLSSRSLPPGGDVAQADGVVLLGGGDIDPQLYGELGTVPGLYGVDRAADVRSFEVVRATIDRGTPLLGVCRGSQVLNVALGGDLVPHLPDTGMHRGTDPGEPFLDETVRLAEHSWIAEILGRTELKVRNGHHQAVRRLGAGLRAVGRAADGTVEAVEHEELWAKGVQWHPEDPDGDPGDAAAVFGRFVEQARITGAAR